MIAPTFIVIALLGQTTPAPSPYIGHWEGKITYSRSDEPWPTDIEIVDLVIDEKLAVSGKFGKPAAESSKTKIGGNDAKISSDGEFGLTLLWIGKEPAFAHFRGTIELSKDGLTMTGKKVIVRDFGKSKGSWDDLNCPATVELHRVKPAAPSGHLFTSK